MFSAIEDKKKKLDGLRPLTEGEVARLREEFLIEFTYNSNAIEGNTLTLRETAMVLEGVTIDQKPLKDHLEVVGHKEAYAYILELVQQKTELTEREIKEIHALVLMNKPRDRGIYRSVPVRIMGASHQPPQPYLVAKQMEALMIDYQEMKEKLHPVEATAGFHLRFEGIHPFIDGNGRTGRLIMNLELMKHGYPPINVKFTDRRKYYDAFHAYYGDARDAGPMIVLIGGYLEETLDRYIGILG